MDKDVYTSDRVFNGIRKDPKKLSELTRSMVKKSLSKLGNMNDIADAIREVANKKRNEEKD